MGMIRIRQGDGGYKLHIVLIVKHVNTSDNFIINAEDNFALAA